MRIPSRFLLAAGAAAALGAGAVWLYRRVQEQGQRDPAQPTPRPSGGRTSIHDEDHADVDITDVNTAHVRVQDAKEVDVYVTDANRVTLHVSDAHRVSLTTLDVDQVRVDPPVSASEPEPEPEPEPEADEDDPPA